MVIGKNFAWAHMPKAAGDTTYALFAAIPRVIEHADPPTTNDKHALFSARRTEVEGKTLLLNLRRLPEWTLSYCLYTARHGLYPDFVPMPMRSPREMVEDNLGDKHLRWYTEDGAFTISSWLRTEHLVEDFLTVMSTLTDVTLGERAAIEAVDAQNAHHYDRDLASWFTSEQVQVLYESNPIWAETERAIYGDLLAL